MSVADLAPKGSSIGGGGRAEEKLLLCCHSVVWRTAVQILAQKTYCHVSAKQFVALSTVGFCFVYFLSGQAVRFLLQCRRKWSNVGGNATLCSVDAMDFIQTCLFFFGYPLIF
jgi:hypothetical protein